MAELYKNTWFGIGLLITGALLSVISVMGLIFNPVLFGSFSMIVFIFISTIASYMLYNIKKIMSEIKSSK